MPIGCFRMLSTHCVCRFQPPFWKISGGTHVNSSKHDFGAATSGSRWQQDRIATGIRGAEARELNSHNAASLLKPQCQGSCLLPTLSIHNWFVIKPSQKNVNQPIICKYRGKMFKTTSEISSSLFDSKSWLPREPSTYRQCPCLAQRLNGASTTKTDRFGMGAIQSVIQSTP